MLIFDNMAQLLNSVEFTEFAKRNSYVVSELYPTIHPQIA